MEWILLSHILQFLCNSELSVCYTVTQLSVCYTVTQLSVCYTITQLSVCYTISQSHSFWSQQFTSCSHFNIHLRPFISTAVSQIKSLAQKGSHGFCRRCLAIFIAILTNKFPRITIKSLPLKINSISVSRYSKWPSLHGPVSSFSLTVRTVS